MAKQTTSEIVEPVTVDILNKELHMIPFATEEPPFVRRTDRRPYRIETANTTGKLESLSLDPSKFTTTALNQACTSIRQAYTHVYGSTLSASEFAFSGADTGSSWTQSHQLMQSTASRNLLIKPAPRTDAIRELRVPTKDNGYRTPFEMTALDADPLHTEKALRDAAATLVAGGINVFLSGVGRITLCGPRLEALLAPTGVPVAKGDSIDSAVDSLCVKLEAALRLTEEGPRSVAQVEAMMALLRERAEASGGTPSLWTECMGESQSRHAAPSFAVLVLDLSGDADSVGREQLDPAVASAMTRLVHAGVRLAVLGRPQLWSGVPRDLRAQCPMEAIAVHAWR
ncbi:hypothetical protein J8273_0172 [Carpediemonas membranifera]|uniref:Uncharacterized protein n=1 Tax=Carpediemonas membranifera TaxID=201153 RepID=A0A8J6B7V8_9EUKA|nr:hypothetical protein J8273_0172 [Carpediemonas membranifera]|eukprot:KAG9394964.1 hypothetical protein J8273_0172 [Carpediemonas membranifera]